MDHGTMVLRLTGKPLLESPPNQPVDVAGEIIRKVCDADHDSPFRKTITVNKMCMLSVTSNEFHLRSVT